MVAVPLEDLASEGLVGAARTGARGQTSIRTAAAGLTCPALRREGSRTATLAG